MNARDRRAFSMIEALVALFLGLPILAVAWNALLSSRVAERSMALSAAIRGAAILERHLEKDLVCVDVSMGPSACTTDDNVLELCLALPGSTPGRPLVQYARRVYTFEPVDPSSPSSPLIPKRDGTVVGGVALAHLSATIITMDADRWIQVQLVSLDPGLRRRRDGTLVSFATTILVPLRTTLSADFLEDYSSISCQ